MLRHEPYSAESDDVTLESAGLAGQLQAVTDDVGEFLNLGFLVMVSQYHGAAFALEPLESLRRLR